MNGWMENLRFEIHSPWEWKCGADERETEWDGEERGGVFHSG